MPIRMRYLIAVVLLAVSGFAGAQRVLEFRDDLAFSAAEVNEAAARAFAVQLQSIARMGRLDSDPALNRRMRVILDRLLRAAIYERPAAARLDWAIHACTQCDLTATAMAGGKLLISADSVARLALTDDELAYMIAHEMAHVLAEHPREFATAARYFVDNGLARGYVDIDRELGQNLPVLLRMSVVSVQQELDADYIGFILGAHAGYAPEAMLGLLDKLRTDGPPLLGTHPSVSRRMEQARTMLDSARRLAAASVAARSMQSEIPAR